MVPDKHAVLRVVVPNSKLLKGKLSYSNKRPSLKTREKGNTFLKPNGCMTEGVDVSQRG